MRTVGVRTVHPLETKMFLYQQYKEDSPLVYISDFEYRRWYHFCLTFRYKGNATAEVAFYFDGKKRGSCKYSLGRRY